MLGNMLLALYKEIKLMSKSEKKTTIFLLGLFICY